MVSEKIFSKICDCIPLSLPKMEKRKPPKLWFRVVLALFQILHVCVVTAFLTVVEVENFESFILKMNLFSYTISTAVYGVYNFFAYNLDIITLEELEEFDASLNVSLSLNFDPCLCFLLSSTCLHCFGLVFVLRGNPNEIVWFIDLTMSFLAVVQVTTFNFMISKRLKFLVNLYQENNDGVDVYMNFARKMFSMLDRLERAFSVRTGIALFREFMVLAHSLLIYWTVYGLKHQSDSIELRHPWVTILAHHQFVWEFLTLGLAAEMVTNEVGNCIILVSCNILI